MQRSRPITGTYAPLSGSTYAGTGVVVSGQDRNHTIGKTWVGELIVSTIFVGDQPHALRQYETMIFRSGSYRPYDPIYFRPYNDRQAAIDGHRVALRWAEQLEGLAQEDEQELFVGRNRLAVWERVELVRGLTTAELVGAAD